MAPSSTIVGVRAATSTGASPRARSRSAALGAGSLPALLRALFPLEVAVAGLAGDGPGAAPCPAEERLVAAAPASRQRAFAAGRACAHAALTTLGAPRAPLGRDAAGRPAWPEGFVGAITHTGGLAAAAVAPRERVAGVGLDAERRHPAAAIARRICTHEELRELARLAEPERSLRLTVLFSAKESAIKALPGPVAAELGLSELGIDARGGRFHVSLRGDRIDGDGRFTVADGLVLTALSLPA